MTLDALLADLEGRGVRFEPRGDRLHVSAPRGVVTPADRARLAEAKAEILALLRDRSPSTPRATYRVRLDPATVREVCGPQPDPHDLGALRLDVMAAVVALEAEIQSGVIAPGVRLVRGRPLADWLNLDDVARLLRLARPTRSRP